MDRAEGKPVRFFWQTFADEFIGGDSAKSLESFGEVVSRHEISAMDAQLFMVTRLREAQPLKT